MMDFNSIFKIKQLWDRFCTTHPKMPAFISQIRSKGFCEGQEIAIAVRYPDGSEFKTGIRVQADDLELLNALKTPAK